MPGEITNRIVVRPRSPKRDLPSLESIQRQMKRMLEVDEQ